MSLSHLLNTSGVGVLLTVAVWLMAVPAQAQVFDCPTCQYETILGVNESITGVRGYDSTGVVLTGSYVENGGAPQGQWWQGSLQTGSGTTYRVSPALSGQTVTSSIYYGPNTALFDPGLGSGNIRVVGSYQYKESPPAVHDHGVMYTGPLNGTGPTATWTQIDVPSTCAGGTVANTIPHSTMGDLVVGNYDLLGAPGSFNAFVYNISTSSCTPFAFDPIFGTDALITAYGVWQNGIGSSHYTIAGGARHEGINQAFLVDYSPTTGFSNPTYFREDSLAGVSHFEGITGRDGGYNLVGTVVGPGDRGAVFVSIDRRPDGTFGRATWVPIKYPDAPLPSAQPSSAPGIRSSKTTPWGFTPNRAYPGWSRATWSWFPASARANSQRHGHPGRRGPGSRWKRARGLKISGVFAFGGPINLAAAGATVSILAGLNEGGSGGELVLGVPLKLAADARNTAKTSRFKTGRGETPGAEVTIGNHGRGQFCLPLAISRTTIDEPAGCPRPSSGR